MAARALQIDRRAAVERQWQRQAEREARLEQLASSSSSPHKSLEVLEVHDLAELESVCQSAGTSLVCLFMYSKVRNLSTVSTLAREHVGPWRALAGTAAASWLP